MAEPNAGLFPYPVTVKPGRAWTRWIWNESMDDDYVFAAICAFWLLSLAITGGFCFYAGLTKGELKASRAQAKALAKREADRVKPSAQ